MNTCVNMSIKTISECLNVLCLNSILNYAPHTINIRDNMSVSVQRVRPGLRAWSGSVCDECGDELVMIAATVYLGIPS